LAALLGDEDGLVSVGPEVREDNPSDSGLQPDPTAKFEDGQVVLLAVDQIEGNPFQPRRDFSQAEIASLAESLKEHDMLQPVLVRRWKGRWQLISGERRLRAAVQAGWKKVPARIRDADDRLVAELAIVENLQRKDLNPIEKALSFRRYLDEHQCKQEDLARRIKIDRSTIANLMRLLELPEAIRSDLQTGSITVGHARALLPLGDEALQMEYADRIRREGLNVRDIERMVQEHIEREEEDGNIVSPRRGRRGRRQRSTQVASLEQQLRIALGTKVDINESGSGRGRIVVHFRGPEEFERLQQLFLGEATEQVTRVAG
jgi:ParB family chromosome partitioning protein